MKKLDLIFSILIFSQIAFANGLQPLSEDLLGGTRPAIQGEWGGPGLPELYFEDDSDTEVLPDELNLPDGLTLPDDFPEEPSCRLPVGGLINPETALWLPDFITQCPAGNTVDVYNDFFADDPNNMSIDEEQYIEKIYNYYCLCK